MVSMGNVDEFQTQLLPCRQQRLPRWPVLHSVPVPCCHFTPPSVVADTLMHHSIPLTQSNPARNNINSTLRRHQDNVRLPKQACCTLASTTPRPFIVGAKSPPHFACPPQPSHDPSTMHSTPHSHPSSHHHHPTPPQTTPPNHRASKPIHPHPPSSKLAPTRPRTRPARRPPTRSSPVRR